MPLLSDTVGFVRRLPHELVEAFRSTLEEVTESDLLLHVVDASDEDPDRQIAAVRNVLGEIGGGDIPELVVINKIDIAEPATVERLQNVYPGAVAGSALNGDGMGDILAAIAAVLGENATEIELLIPYDRGEAIALAHRLGQVLSQEHADGGTAMKVQLPPSEVYRFAEWIPGRDPTRDA